MIIVSNYKDIFSLLKIPLLSFILITTIRLGFLSSCFSVMVVGSCILSMKKYQKLNLWGVEWSWKVSFGKILGHSNLQTNSQLPQFLAKTCQGLLMTHIFHLVNLRVIQIILEVFNLCFCHCYADIRIIHLCHLSKRLIRKWIICV